MQDFKLKEEYKAIEAVQEAEQEALLNKSNVEGVAIGHKIVKGVDTGEPCVSVFVSQKLDDDLLGPNQKIELKDKNFTVDVIETGVIFAGEAVTKPSSKSKRPVAREEPPTSSPPSYSPVTSLVPDYLETDIGFLEEEIDIETLRTRVRPAKGGYSVGALSYYGGYDWNFGLRSSALPFDSAKILYPQQ